MVLVVVLTVLMWCCDDADGVDVVLVVVLTVLMW